MNIKLPNLDINIDEGLDNKEILQQILDAINKQRKELNFYLMNLSEDNMPTIAGRMEDMEGNISLINQDIDEILLLVANNAEDIAALSVRADQIQAQVANNAGDIAALNIRADQIQAQVANNAGDIAALSIRADEIQAQVTDNAGNIASLSLRADEIAGRVADAEGNISQLVIRADEIETVVVDNHEYVTTQLVLLGDEIVEVETTLSNQISIVSQTASQIQTQVSNLVTEVSDLSITVTENYSTLTQRADSIESTVSSISYEVSELSTTVTENYSTLTQRADRIESTVSSISYSVDGLEDDMDWAYSQIIQLADEITVKVTIDDVVNYLSIDRSGVKIHANNIDLTGITTIYSSNGRYYTEMYGNSLIINISGESFTIQYDGVAGWNIYTDGEPIRFYRGVALFEDDVVFENYVDFTHADVIGLDIDIDTRYLIECYYAANKCYIDYGGGNRLTIRDRNGRVVGYISFDD